VPKKNIPKKTALLVLTKEINMLGTLLRRLLDPQPETLSDVDARVALTALLVRIAKSDHDYSVAEIDRIDRILMARYDITQTAATDLRQQAEAIESDAPDTVRFTRAIKDAVPYDQRQQVVASAWAVALADGARSQEEDALMRMISNLLGVSDVDSARARQAAAKT
jgi:uncharacterized tellurite resistance protein B-like protein